MGERESISQQNEAHDTLRNFPLRLNLIEDLELDRTILANEMALRLATIHWQAQIDAMDIEFVLAGSATVKVDLLRPISDAQATPVERRHSEMWILDFNKAS